MDMDKVFVRMNGMYICPRCNKEHNISGEYETDEDFGMYDSGRTIECCGIDFGMTFNFE